MLYAQDFRRSAREALRGRWVLAVITGLAAVLLGANSIYGNASSNRHNNAENIADFHIGISIPIFISWFLSMIVLFVLIYLIIGGTIQLGYCAFNLNLMNNTNPQFQDLFSRFDIFWKAFGLRVLTTLYTMLWALLLIIPGIIAALSYSMAPYILTENPSMGVSEAIEQSKELMDGNKWRLFCLTLSFIGWAILSALTLGIGYLWLNPYANAAYAAFYNDISGKD
jgi:uncharacterized membrane protein